MACAEIKVLADAAGIAAEAGARIVRASKDAISLRGRFSLALSGGSTPRLLYALLADEYHDVIDWSQVLIFFGDERCVGPDHPESNFRMARETLLSKVPIPGDNIHRMRGEIEPEESAEEYGLMLKGKFGDGGLDLVLLGMGEDGHTASLFPGTSAVGETHHRVVANYAEHSTTGKSWRITLTAPFINRSGEVLFLVSGADKAEALREVMEGPRQPEKYPAQLIEPGSGRVTWLVDAAAAEMKTD